MPEAPTTGRPAARRISSDKPVYAAASRRVDSGQIRTGSTGEDPAFCPKEAAPEPR
jgi:hypothetical protein